MKGERNEKRKKKGEVDMGEMEEWRYSEVERIRQTEQNVMV